MCPDRLNRSRPIVRPLKSQKPSRVAPRTQYYGAPVNTGPLHACPGVLSGPAHPSQVKITISFTKASMFVVMSGLPGLSTSMIG